MKTYYWLLTLIFAIAALPCKADEWIRINQLGYLPQSIKVAVFMSEADTDVKEYALVDAFTGKTVRTFTSPKATGKLGGMNSTYRLDFSSFQEPGTYYLKAGKAVSPRFPINAQVYNGTADFLLNYMRQQRCGYNPFLKVIRIPDFLHNALHNGIDIPYFFIHMGNRIICAFQRGRQLLRCCRLIRHIIYEFYC